MIQPQGCNRGYECQVCDAPLTYDSEDDKAHVMKQWVVHSFDHTLGELHILTCPACSDLTAEQVLAGYRKRILSGRDLNFH